MSNVVNFPAEEIRSVTDLERIIRAELRRHDAPPEVVSRVIESMREFLKLLVFSFHFELKGHSPELEEQFASLSRGLVERTNELLMERLLVEIRRAESP